MLSLLTSVLEEEPGSRVTLLYGNRTTGSVMFLEELEDLKNRYLGRFQLVTVLSREPHDVELFTGRLDPERVARILEVLAPVDTVDEWYLCGPYGMVVGAQELLAEAGVDAAHVHHEIFHVAEQESPRQEVTVVEGAPPAAVVTVSLDGRTTRIEMPIGGGDHPRRHAAGAAGRAVLVHGWGLRDVPRPARVRRGADGPQLRAGAGRGGGGDRAGVPEPPGDRGSRPGLRRLRFCPALLPGNRDHSTLFAGRGGLLERCS